MTDNNPVEVVKKIEASIGVWREEDKKFKSALEDSVQKTGKDATDAVKMAEKSAQDLNAISVQMLELQQKLAEGVVRGTTSINTLGDIVVKSEKFTQFAANGGAGKLRIEANTITGQEGSPATNSDTLVPAQRREGIVPLAFRTLNLRDLVPAIPVQGNSFEFTRELAFTNNAAEAAEGATKGESSITYELINTPIRTVAHFIKASKQILDDAPALSAQISNRLVYGANLRLESQLITGDGTGQNISGITDSGNYTAFTPTSGETSLDSLNRMIQALDVADYGATGFVLNPADWHAIERLKDSQLRYLIGNPQGTIGRTLWGLPVLVNNSLTAGTAVCANFQIAFNILDRSGTVVEIFEQDDVNVQKNLLTIRAENRAALASYRPASARVGSLTA